MEAENPAIPDHNNVLDVSSARLSDLLRSDDPHLANAVAELVRMRQQPVEVTLGWQSFLDQPGFASPERSSSG